MRLSRAFTTFASATARAAGRPATFGASLVVILAWALSGPVFRYSDTWQLIINTGTTIITFLMVFLIQNTQNRDGAAIQAKLDELIRVSAAQNRYIGIEALTDEELADLRERCASQARGGRASEAAETADEAEEAAHRKARQAAEKAGGVASYPR